MSMPPPPPGQGPIGSPPPGAMPPRGPFPPSPGAMPYPPMPPMMMPPPRQGGGFAKGILVTLATTIFGASLLLNLYLIAALGVTRSESSAFEAVETPLVAGGGGDASQKVAIVKLEGVITDASAKPLIQLLDHVQQDAAVRALVLEINSPGGGVTASDEIYARVVRLKAEKKIPVYVSMGSLAASGGYYVSMAADKLYASETSITGSIGVILQRFDITEFAAKYGVKDGSIVSDGATYKESGSAFKPLTEDETAYFKSFLNDARDTFKARIKSGRPNLTTAKIDAAANGKVYSAKQALALGLIDNVGYLGDASADISKAAGLAKPLVVRVERQLSFAEKLLGGQAGVTTPVGGVTMSAGPANVTVDRALLDDVLRPRAMYLWQGR